MIPALALKGIRKRFGEVQALDDVDLELRHGEILALVGENGAGKSTLMNVACGLYRPDAGSLEVRGRPVTLRGPRDAIALGIGMVHQHFMLVPPLTVAENVVLGQEPRRHGLLDRAAMVRGVRDVAERYGFELDPDAIVEQIGVGAQQRVEIVKALYRGADLLILDEPTANLTPQEARDFLAVARRLAEDGRGVVFISHKLREVLAVADRVVVMRRGRKVWEGPAAGTREADLAERMVGQGFQGLAPRPPARPPGVTTLLRAEDLRARNERGVECLFGVSLALRPGEILAIAGVDGNGQAELAEVLTGLRPSLAGHVEMDGRDLTGRGPRAFRDAGVAHVPADRQRRGLCLDLSLEENLVLGRQDRPPFSQWGLRDFPAMREAAIRLTTAYDVRPADPSLPARAFSGGNQQKIILAREIDREPRVLVAVQPTRGLDIGAMALVHQRLRDERDRGRGVLLFSLDLDEILALADRILVLHGGRVMGVVAGEGAEEGVLGRMMMGRPLDAEAARA
jgi:simple sugar transport system ATP-binding protein